MNISNLLENLSYSKFRSKFHLAKTDISYINEKGMDTIKEHAYSFINKRLKPKIIINDGKQTPYKGHPVFIAQHATATCCRGCLNKWYKIDKDIELTNEQIDFIVSLIMEWTKKEYNLKK